MTFNARTTSEEIVEGLDLSGKTIVVTGSSGGLGFEMARVLAGAGAGIVMVARNAEKNEQAAARIRKAQPDARLGLVTLDLGEMASVRRGAAEILAAYPRIDVLINNAGVMGGPLRLTPDGLEHHWAVNHIGPFLLTNLLYPALKAAAPARIVVMSSAGHRLPGLDLDDPNFANRPYEYYLAYCQSKRANVLFAVALTRRLKGTGITANAVHPGAIRTDVFRDLGEEAAAQAMAWSAASGSPEKTHSQGAATAMWAAVHPALDGISGQYLEDCGLAPHIPSGDFGAAGVIEEALDLEVAERVWAVSEQTVGQRFALP